jgi:hypothetical protein
MTYSILNNYQYSDKNYELLDTLSYPLRTCLGGHTIRLCAEKKELFPSTITKITMLLVSFFLFPVTIVSAGCLAIKALLNEEQKRVTELLKKVVISHPHLRTSQPAPSKDAPIPVKREIDPVSPSITPSVATPKLAMDIASQIDLLWKNPYLLYEKIVEARRPGQSIFPLIPALVFLGLCNCPKMPVSLRLNLEESSIHLLSQTHPKNAPITVLSVGPGHAYQELVYLAKLAHVGYKRITLMLIDPYKETLITHVTHQGLEKSLRIT